MSIAACRLLGPAVSSVAAAIVATPTPHTVTLLVPAAAIGCTVSPRCCVVALSCAHG
ncbi:hypothetical protein AURDEDRAFT_177326 [Auricularia subglabra TFB-10046 SS5]|uniref:Hydrophobin n=1 Tax=Auricularia subglabra (strain TFB-10046 / SS5) TaxID=717982 RepID=J0WP06_AURST|nr:hypothetical protein AURDEDRAFT_177326 [Auricularia subglabra TFB-10046 SS5]